MAKCSDADCARISGSPTSPCHNDQLRGQVVYFEIPPGSGNTCYCVCSCLAYNTPVAVAASNWAKIQEIKVGDSVLALQSNKSWKSTKVVFSDGVPPLNQSVPAGRIMFFVQTVNDITLVVTEEHLFLLADGTLKRANRLTPDDQLVDENMKPVGIVGLGRGVTRAGFHNIATSPLDKKGDDKWNHLINTAGVVSGDFYAQLYLGNEHPESDPIVGTPEYLTKHGKKAEAKLVPGAKGLKLAGFTTFGLEPLSTKVDIPAHATSFIQRSAERNVRPEMLRAMDDTVSYEMAVSLRDHFQRFFPSPGVDIRIEWADNTVNAFACEQNGVKRVWVMGGLIRHVSIQQEGLGLIIAHELGHHFGRRDPGGSHDQGCGNLACEGEADFWGANEGMRVVWWGPEYVRQLRAGVDQVINFFLALGDPSEPDPCGHKNAACRRDTYLAALYGQPKPACSGPPNP